MESDDVYAEDCRPPGPGEQVGWRELTPEGVVVQWGPPIVLELVAAAGPAGDDNGSA